MSPARDTASRRRPERLRHRADFSRVMRQGRRARHTLLQLVAFRTGDDLTRIGFSVGKQVGGAVTRNRVKRRLREIVRGQHWRGGYDIVLLARPGAEEVTYEELQDATCANARKLGLLENVKS